MPLMIVVLTLFAALIAADADAETDAERLAEMFSPILILTKDISPDSDYGEDGGIRVLKPEPVEIMGAQSAENLRFRVYSLEEVLTVEVEKFKGVFDSYSGWVPPLEDLIEGDKVSFLENKFAFFVNGLYDVDPRIGGHRRCAIRRIYGGPRTILGCCETPFPMY